MIADEYEDMARPIVEKYFSKCKIYFDGNPYLPNNIDKNVSLEDILKMGNLLQTMLRIVIDGNEVEDFQKRAQIFMDEWRATGWSAFIRIFAINSEDFVSYTRDSFQKMLNNNKLVELVAKRINCD